MVVATINLHIQSLNHLRLGSLRRGVRIREVWSARILRPQTSCVTIFLFSHFLFVGGGSTVFPAAETRMRVNVRAHGRTVPYPRAPTPGIGVRFLTNYPVTIQIYIT